MRRILNIVFTRALISLFVAPFFGIVTPGYGLDVTLGWHVNVEQDLSGYKVYYRTGSFGPPYTGSGAREGESPIAVDKDEVTVGDICRFTLSGLSDNQLHCFVVTAYDDYGNESDFSDEACLSGMTDDSGGREPSSNGAGGAVEPEPRSTSSGEGGGGGCFIATMPFESRMVK